jgi:outer membrane protein assembly factor BamE (lipoprotein component of BamABCDE complex)
MKKPNYIRGAAILSIAIFAMGSAGCSRLRTHQGYIGDEVLINAITAGVDNKQSVEASLGRPTFVGQFGENDWYYFSRDTRQLAFAQPKPSAQILVHVSFDKSGNVVSVGKTGIETIANINPNGDKTPTLGKQRGFFEDLFGNIGTVGAPGAGGGAGGGN